LSVKQLATANESSAETAADSGSWVIDSLGPQTTFHLLSVLPINMDSPSKDFIPPECKQFYSLISQFKESGAEIQFFNDPSEYPSTPYIKQSSYLRDESDHALFRLDPEHAPSQLLIKAHSLGVQIVRKARQKNKALVQEVCKNLDQIQEIKSIIWNFQRQSPTTRHYDLATLSPIPLICAISPLFHKEFNHTTYSDAQLIYDTHKAIAIEALNTPADRRNSILDAISHMPVNVKSLPKSLGMTLDSDTYIMCPTCFALYDHNTLQPIQTIHNPKGSSDSLDTIFSTHYSHLINNESMNVDDEDYNSESSS
ncbi:9110_t:CDS:2, partial [Acaulospora colombiana]